MTTLDEQIEEAIRDLQNAGEGRTYEGQIELSSQAARPSWFGYALVFVVVAVATFVILVKFFS